MIWSHGRVIAPLARRLGGLAAALALSGSVVVVGAAGPASAAECVSQGVAMSARQAAAIFSGTVESAEVTPLPDGQQGVEVVHEVTVDLVYKGRPEVSADNGLRVRTLRGTIEGCDLGRIPSGTDYVFFVRADGDVWFATRNGGTAASTADLVSRLERIYPNPRPPLMPEPPEATFTRVDTDTATTSLSRAAAPGAAMVLIGLLGLFVVRRVNS